MFLGVSHLILTTDGKNNSEIIDILINIGYKINFIENKLENNKLKFNFMFNNNKYHNITFLKHKSRYAIEVIEYEEVTNIKNNLLVSFESKLNNTDKEVNKILDYSIYYNEILNIEYFVSSENKFIFKTNNIEEEIIFWNRAGFKNIDNKVTIKSPLVQWRGNIEFIKDTFRYSYMDNVGVNTICLLTNDINKEGNKVDIAKTEIFNMNVNNKRMSNLLVKRDSYNIELLEIK
jgi:hypothetical protein